MSAKLVHAHARSGCFSNKKTNGCSSLNIHFRWGVSIVLGSFRSNRGSGTIKSCIRIQKIVFWAFQKNNHDVTLDIHLVDFGILGK